MPLSCSEPGQTLGFCRFELGAQEIFAAEAPPGVRFPDLANDDPEIVGRSYVFGDDALENLRV